jgi:cytoskeletal protein RodZ
METVGKILKNTRINKKLTLANVEKSTKIRQKNLEAVENEDWDKFSSKTYINGIVRQYSKYLELNEEKMAAFFRREYEKTEDINFKTKIKEKYLTPQTKTAFRLSLIFIFIAFFLYFGYQLKQFFTPPHLEIITPKESRFKKMERVSLIGKTDKETTIYVNGERIFLKKDNTFETYVPLFQEKNPIYIEAVGANGKKTTISKIFIRE